MTIEVGDAEDETMTGDVAAPAGAAPANAAPAAAITATGTVRSNLALIPRLPPAAVPIIATTPRSAGFSPSLLVLTQSGEIR